LRGLPGLLEGAELCLTGEGSLDAQTLGGKTVDGVTRFALAAGVPAIVAFAGRVDAVAERVLAERGVIVMPLPDGPLTLEGAMSGAAALLERASARVAGLLAVQLRLRTPLSRKNGSSK
jgi:glycerate kinase